MSTCNCDGTVTGVLQLLPDAAYHVAGTTSPSEDATTACQEALAQMRALGMDCSTTDPETLDAIYQAALDEVGQTVSTEPGQNPLQLGVDQAIGTASLLAQVMPTTPKPQATNWTLIIGIVAILAFGFFLLVRA